MQRRCYVLAHSGLTEGAQTELKHYGIRDFRRLSKRHVIRLTVKIVHGQDQAVFDVTDAISGLSHLPAWIRDRRSIGIGGVETVKRVSVNNPIGIELVTCAAQNAS